MDFVVSIVEGIASVPGPLNLAGCILAALYISRTRLAYGAGAAWGVGLWLAGVLLDRPQDWTAQQLSAQALGSLSGHLGVMWILLTVMDSVRAIRARWRARRIRPRRRA